MSRTLCLALTIVFLAASPGHAQSDFHGVDWGSSREAVIREHGFPDRYLDPESGEQLMYERTVGGAPAQVYFKFCPSLGGLCGGTYIFTTTHSEMRGYATDYRDVTARLTDQYGRPDTTRRPRNATSLTNEPPLSRILQRGRSVTQFWYTSEGALLHRVSATLLSWGQWIGAWLTGTPPQPEVDHIVQYMSPAHLKARERAPGSSNLF